MNQEFTEKMEKLRTENNGICTQCASYKKCKRKPILRNENRVRWCCWFSERVNLNYKHTTVYRCLVCGVQSPCEITAVQHTNYSDYFTVPRRCPYNMDKTPVFVEISHIVEKGE